MRSRSQASEAAAFEVFNINQLRDVISAATGKPSDEDQWGRRVSGGDALSVDIDIQFGDLGNLCGRINDAHARDDYKDNFDWIDYIQPVNDPALRSRLEHAVLECLEAPGGQGLEIAPPEVIDWQQVSSFHYHYDRRQGRANSAVTHPELRLSEYLAGLRHHGLHEDVGIAHLRTRRIDAVDGSGSPVHQWTVWKCLVGEITVGGATYILDEGEFFSIRDDYLAELDAYINGIPESRVTLPTSTRSTHEGDYNEAAATAPGFMMLDRRTINVEGRTTQIEICDLLTTQRELIHVKRHLGSSDLSHLFAQGFVSAELLQMNPAFRHRAHERVVEFAGGRQEFFFFDTAAFVPHDFTVVYAIIADWNGRTMTQALPFFSKVNLRGVADELRSRDFRVELSRIQTT